MKAAGFKPTRLKGSGSEYDEMPFRGFTGLNNKFSPIEIEDTEASDLLNVEFDERGAIKKRNGYTLRHNFPQPVKSMIPYEKSDGTKHLIVTYGTTIVEYDPINDVVVSTITTNLHGNGLRFTGSVDSAHDTIYLMNGDTTDGLMKWDGSNFQHIVGAPNGKYVLWYANHLYVAGDPSAPVRLYMSNQGDPTTWPALNYVDYVKDGPIYGLSQLGDRIVVFKEHQLYLLLGTDLSDYKAPCTYANVGTVNHWSIVNIPNGLVFLAHDGVYVFDGKKVSWLSQKINIDNWNQQQLQNAVAFEYNHKYWLSVPEGTGQSTNNYTYVFDYEYEWWTKHNLAIQCACQLSGVSESPTPYFGDLSGNVMQADTGGNDNGLAIDAWLTTKAYDFGYTAHKKRFKAVYMFAQAEPGSYKLSLTFIQDFGRRTKTIQMPLGFSNPSNWGAMLWGVDPWDGTGSIAHSSTSVPGQSQYLQFKLEGADKDAPFTFLGWVVRYKVKRRMG